MDKADFGRPHNILPFVSGTADSEGMASKSARRVDVLESEDHVGTEVVRSADDIAKQFGSEGKHDGSEGNRANIGRMDR